MAAVRAMMLMPSGSCSWSSASAQLVAGLRLRRGARRRRRGGCSASGPGICRQGNERREGRALGAALVLLDLDDQLLAFAQRILDAGAADVDAFLEVTAGDFLERQEAVALLAVVYESRFEAGLDAGNDAL
jgi:hypothetical protein